MEKIIPVYFYKEEYSTILHDGVVQWDIGTKLRIIGLDVSTDMVEVHFSLTENKGDASRMVGEVVNGNILVDIPKMITEVPEQKRSFYEAYAFVYLIGEDASRTVHKITMYVQSRPMPAEYSSPSELSFLEQLEVLVKNKISIPEFATVGQVIAVKSVDENGKPIEFEAVTQSGGGSSSDYTLPQATSDALGGVKADEKTDTDTVPARIGTDGKLYVEKYPSEIKVDNVLNEESENPVQNKVITKKINELSNDIVKIKEDVNDAETLLAAI